MPLPPVLAEFLKVQAYALLLQPTDQGPRYVVNVPRADKPSARGPVPMGVQHERDAQPLAPVLHTLLRIDDQPHAPLAFEKVVNVDDSAQRAAFAALAAQETLQFRFYDAALSHRFTKALAHPGSERIPERVREADRLCNAVAIDAYDVDRAHAEGLAPTTL